MLTKIGLAPMEGVTDYPFRLWVYLVSQPDWLATPFLRVTPAFPHAVPLAWAPELFHPTVKYVTPYRLVPQLMSPSAELFVATATKYFATIPCVELNCGCPSPKVVGNGSGSSLLKSVAGFHNSILQISNSLPSKQLAIKMRTGFDDDSLFTDLYQGLQNISLTHLTIHGRTKEQRYSGLANWQHIEQAARFLPHYTIGSGDIIDLHTLNARLSSAPSIDAVVIGRGVLRNPWIFSDLRSGIPTALSVDLIYQALVSYALLSESYARDFEQVLTWVGNHATLIKKPHCDNLEMWQDLNKRLLDLFSHKSIRDVSFSKQTLGRVKMIWCYLQQQDLFISEKPQLALRAQSMNDFFDILRKKS